MALDRYSKVIFSVIALALAALATVLLVGGAAAYDAGDRAQLIASKNCAECDLAGAYLAGADLDYANLTNANLVGADLSDSSMLGAELVGADLTDANLFRAILRGANLTNANLTGARLFGSNRIGATYCNTTMPNGSINNADC